MSEDIDDYGEWDSLLDEEIKSSGPEEIEIPKPETKGPRSVRIAKNFDVPDYNDLMSFAKKYMDNDVECEQFFRHGSTRYLYKQQFNKERGGGGWSGSIKATINILNKMKKRGAL